MVTDKRDAELARRLSRDWELEQLRQSRDTWRFLAWFATGGFLFMVAILWRFEC